MKQLSTRKIRKPTLVAQQKAVAHFQSRQYEQAAAQARILIRSFPQHLLGWKLLGAALHALHQLDEALAADREAVRLAPHDGEALNNLGHTLIECGRLADAERVLRQSITIDASNADAHTNLGVALQRQGLLQGAAEAFEHSLLIAPDQPQALCGLAGSLYGLGQVERAAGGYRRALDLAPDYLEAHQGYGLLSQRLGRLPLAIEHLRRALELRLGQPSREVKQVQSASFDTPQHEALLWQTLAQLGKAGVHAFACAGTLLGLVREGGLLPFDKDLDFGLPHTEQEAARVCLLAHGWQENVHNFGLINPRHYVHRDTGLSLDLCGFLVEPDTGVTVSGFWLKDVPPGWNRITEYPTLNLLQQNRPEGRVWTLAEPEPWLAVLYGDWRTPDPDFDTVIAAHNQRGFSLLTQCYAFSRILERWQRGHLKKALATTHHSLRHLPDDALLQQVHAHLQTAQVTTNTVQAVSSQKEQQ